MARSFSEGKGEGIFPYRHFLETHHEKVIPWAEEFPLYVGVIAVLHKWTGFSIVLLGRYISFFFFAVLLLGGWYLGKALKFGIFLPLLLALFPVFRIYAVSVMPEIPMAAFCLWAIYFALKNRWGFAALMIGFAAAMKYYATFCAL